MTLALRTQEQSQILLVWLFAGAISASNSSEIYVDGTTWFGNNSASMGGGKIMTYVVV